MDSAEQVLQWLAEEYQADPGNWSAYADSTYDAMPADAGEPGIPDDLALADGSADAVWKAFSQLTEDEAQDLVDKGIIAFEYVTS